MIFSVYEVRGEGPETYVGFTCDTGMRWKCHKQCARSGDPAPLCVAMRERGIESFSLRSISRHRSRHTAMRAEKREIARRFIREEPLFNRYIDWCAVWVMCGRTYRAALTPGTVMGAIADRETLSSVLIRVQSQKKDRPQ